MIYMLIGILSAMFFGLVSFTTYGYEALLNDPWIDYIVWWLIGTGVVLAALDNTVTFRCGICSRIHRRASESSAPLV